MTISECVRSSPRWGVVKSLGYYRRGPVGLVLTQNFQFFLKQKTHFCGRKLQDDLSEQGPKRHIRGCQFFLAIRGRPEKRKYSRESGSNMGNPGIKSVSN